MDLRRTCRIGAIAATLLIAGCGDDANRRRSDEATERALVVRSCGTRVEGRLAPGWRRLSVAAGPLTFAYAQTLDQPDDRRGFVDEKMLVVLKAGHEATVTVTASEQGEVALDYDSFEGTHSPPRLSDGVSTVRFIACRGDEKPFTRTHSLRRETQFNGGIIARRPSCVDLDAFIDGRDTPERVTIPFGARNCDGRG
jgi:hypothetical protein